MEPHLRKAITADVEALVALESRAGATFKTAGLPWVAELSSAASDLLELMRNGTVWVLEAEGNILGWAGARWPGRAGHLQELDVDPAHQHKGHGRRLLHHVLQAARARSCHCVALTTFRDVPWNGPWYRREGFHVWPAWELPSWLQRIRAHERTIGLDRAPRVVMVRRL